MDIKERPSPNRGARPADVAVDMVVLHYTGMQSAAAAIDRLCDPQAAVSAHYVVEEDGAVWRLVPEHQRAWHAGESCWAGARNINDRSIGIEMVNPGHEFGYRAFPEAQMAALETLLDDILLRHGIAPARVVGHADVAPKRKQDPGELFDWRRLAARGLAIWPLEISAPPGSVDMRTALNVIGYDAEAALADVIAAFQRRFVPDGVSGVADDRTAAAAAAVAALCVAMGITSGPA